MNTITKLLRRLRSNRGSSVVEFAVLTPLLLMLTLGAIDFGRVFVEANEMASGANAGVVYGARRMIDSQDFAGIQAAALADTENAENATAVVERFCDCPDNPGVAVSCIDGTCVNYGLPRVYVRTRITKTFTTFGRYPGVPYSVPMTMNGFMRVQ